MFRSQLFQTNQQGQKTLEAFHPTTHSHHFKFRTHSDPLPRSEYIVGFRGLGHEQAQFCGHNPHIKGPGTKIRIVFYSDPLFTTYLE